MQPSHPDADHPDSRDPAATDQPNPNLLRDRLANERTFLAWLRTGIAITGLGFVVARFDLFLRQMAALTESTGTPVTSTTVSLGVVLVLAGPVLVGLAALRFWQTERALTRNQPASQQSASVLVLAVTGGALVAGIALALHLVTTLPD